MKVKVKIISSSTSLNLEKDVNAFLDGLTEAQAPTVGNIVISQGGYYVIPITYKSL
jgi:hypothetical protein